MHKNQDDLFSAIQVCQNQTLFPAAPGVRRWEDLDRRWSVDTCPSLQVVTAYL